jgi:hypothetical protein
VTTQTKTNLYYALTLATLVASIWLCWRHWHRWWAVLVGLLFAAIADYIIRAALFPSGAAPTSPTTYA